MTSKKQLEADLFRHVSAEKAALYRDVMECFAAAKRQFRLQLRPDEVIAEVQRNGISTTLEEIQAALVQLTAWGNLESQPDMARVATLNDYYRARFLYRLSQGGEAVEAALMTFATTMRRRAELQTIALEDIALRLQTLLTLGEQTELDAAKISETLRDLVRVFETLADNAQAFMAGIGRSIELRQAEMYAVLSYKKRLIDYLERFIGDLVGRSGGIARHIETLSPRIKSLVWVAAEREARDSAPGNESEQSGATAKASRAWLERWTGLCRWFISVDHEAPQSEVLRSKALTAIPQLLAAVAMLNDRRSGRSDRSADFRTLAGWFSACQDDQQAHRMARAAFALNPARHFSSNPAHSTATAELPASTPWAEAPPLHVHPRLREYGEATPRGRMSAVRVRDDERKLLALQLKEEHAQIEAARRLLATARATKLSDIGHLDEHAFALFLNLLSEALTAQDSPESIVNVQSGDGLLHIQLEPLQADSHAEIHTAAGVFSGRDHVITIKLAEDSV